MGELVLSILTRDPERYGILFLKTMKRGEKRKKRWEHGWAIIFKTVVAPIPGTGYGRKYRGARVQPLTRGPEADETKTM